MVSLMGAQAAFIQGRSIVDNIHLAQELLRKYARKRGSPRCILKVDIQKAYDTVDWEFLREVLNPLFPFIFTLCLEVLSRSLNKMSRYNGFGFHPKCKELRVAHLAYADDLLLLARGDVCSVSMIMKCLNEFGDMAGLPVNVLKSNIYMASIEPEVRNVILEVTGFCPGILPFRYLGVPLASRQLRSSDYSLLVNAITAKINSWPRQTLSYAGKIELIRVVVQGVECFWFSILPIPKCVIDRIYSLCRKFVWATKHPPIAWDTLCKPMDDGGMGLRDLKAWNNALLAKTLWKIHMKKDSLWIKWVNQIYNRVTCVWNWKVHKEASPLIKKLISLRDVLISRLGSMDAAVLQLGSWFNANGGLSLAYDFFVNRKGRWPWQPLLRKPCILLSTGLRYGY